MYLLEDNGGGNNIRGNDFKFSKINRWHTYSNFSRVWHILKKKQIPASANPSKRAECQRQKQINQRNENKPKADLK